MRWLPEKLLAVMVALGLAAALAPSALACGGLVAPDGDVRLARATTLVAWHNGVEHYLTSFAYEGDVANLGWIVPLPAVPEKIEAGGKWTLQRLFRETHPIQFALADQSHAIVNAAAPGVVVEQTQIEALNITILRGTGQAVLDWCASNGFTINDETRAHLLTYAHGSPIFMAAKYDTAAAKARHQLTGDGAPVLLTMRIAHPWVPLEVLALDGQQVQADLYLLSDMPLYTSDLNATLGQTSVGTQLPGAPGFQLAYQEPMNATLYHDLSTDRNMSWVRSDGWLTYLSLDAPDESVTYDLGVTSRGVIRLAHFGGAPMAIGGVSSVPSWLPQLPLGSLGAIIAIAVVLALFGGLTLYTRLSQRRAKPTAKV